MSFKDTALNIRLTEVFTVNIVSHAIAEAMHVCAVPFGAADDELKAAGLTAMPGTLVASPWIKEAPASFECRRHVTLELGKSRQIILGEIVFAHYHPDVIDVSLQVPPDLKMRGTHLRTFYKRAMADGVKGVALGLAAELSDDAAFEYFE